MTSRMEKIKVELDIIAKKNRGRLAAEKVLDEAKSPRHPLHSEFEWNDKKAGHKYRLEQARELIRLVTISFVHHSVKICAPYYVKSPHVPANQQGHVALTSSEIQQADAVAILLAEIERVEGCVERGRAVAALLDRRFPGAGITAHLESALTQMALVRTKITRKGKAEPPPPVAPGSRKPPPPPPRGRRKPPGGDEARV
jgi:hypothetical protein